MIGKRFANNVKVINLNETELLGDSPSVYLHNDDISALLNVSHATQCVQVAFEK